MAQIIRTQARIEKVSGIPEDAIVNTFHFILEDETRAAAVTAAANIATRLNTFYATFDQLMPNQTLSTTITYKSYTLLDPVPRVPLSTIAGVFAPGNGTAMPSEIAICLSYRGDLASGSNPARRKGRLYLGPWNTTALDVTLIAGEPRPTISTTNLIRQAGQDLAGVVAGLPTWAVFSPTGLTVTPITFVSTDNAFDIQRRRGAKPTARTEIPG